MPRTKNETYQTQFRLRPETLADLDAIQRYLDDAAPGIDHTRSDAVRHAVRQVADGLPKKFQKKLPQST